MRAFGSPVSVKPSVPLLVNPQPIWSVKLPDTDEVEVTTPPAPMSMNVAVEAETETGPVVPLERVKDKPLRFWLKLTILSFVNKFTSVIVSVPAPVVKVADACTGCPPIVGL